MLFNSLAFVLFFPLAVCGYFLTPPRWRWAWLLAASYLFYGWWRWEYLALIVGSTLVDYWTGLRMGAQATKEARKPYLWVSLGANLGLLGTFKYLGFFGDTVNSVLGAAGREATLSVPDLLLPVGISFYTFQTLSYAVDVYRGHKEPERHLGIFALYVSFFPQLVAGPIERSRRLLPQFHATHAFDPVLASSGLRLMLWGFFVKCVVADRMAPYVDVVYSAPEAYAGPAVWAATFAFAWQIYGDFAGYSLIAIGAARVMGFRLMDNFRRPYFSASVGELWRRWHISLMSWFRDYLYAPLGGGKKGPVRGSINLLIIFTVSGLWHGAAWTFVLFGLMHGVFLIVGRLSLPMRNRFWARMEPNRGDGVRTAGWTASVPVVRRAMGIAFTFFLWMMGGGFFRGQSLGDALIVMKHMFVIPEGTFTSIQLPGFDGVDLAMMGLFIGVYLFVDVLEERGKSLDERLAAMPTLPRWVLYLVISLVLILFGSYGAVPFLYFQF
ncbi:MAG: MBOAT family O-acyltransferase [Bacteroidota bacterium]